MIRGPPARQWIATGDVLDRARAGIL